VRELKKEGKGGKKRLKKGTDTWLRKEGKDRKKTAKEWGRF
jgi:hypothetical protein